MFNTIHYAELAQMRRSQDSLQKQFMRTVHALDPYIRRELRAFAGAVWFSDTTLGFLLWGRYRLRTQTQPGKALWWIEKDIPPFDRYRCAAYRIELSQTADGAALLCVQSGSQTYLMRPNDLAALHNSLLQAGHDPALVIPRRMGAALDP